MNDNTNLEKNNKNDIINDRRRIEAGWGGGEGRKREDFPRALRACVIT